MSRGYRHDPTPQAVAQATTRAVAQGAERYQVLTTDSVDRYEVVDWQAHPTRRTMCITDKVSAERIARALSGVFDTRETN